MTVIKYSIAAFRASYAFGNFSPKLAFDSSTFIESIKLNTVFSGADVEHWKNWLGTTTWKTITEECDELIFSWIPTNAPEISGDADTRWLQMTDKNLKLISPATS
jgi:hypothetical protein